MFTGWAATSHRRAPEVLTLVALGDSVTVGVGDRVHDGQREGWAAHLAEMMGASYASVARNGARARDVLADQLEPAALARPELATLLVGGNDVLRADFDPERIGAAVRTVCRELGSAGATVVVVLLHDPGRALPRGGGVFGRVIAARALRVNAALRAAVEGLPFVVLVDPCDAPAIYARESWHIDRMHPSAAGHRLLARTAAEHLAARGFPVVRPVTAVPAECPGPVAHAIWLVRNGIPWFAKRSVDLVPELVRVVVAERSGAEASVGV